MQPEAGGVSQNIDVSCTKVCKLQAEENENDEEEGEAWHVDPEQGPPLHSAPAMVVDANGAVVFGEADEYGRFAVVSLVLRGRDEPYVHLVVEVEDKGRGAGIQDQILSIGRARKGEAGA